jgi:hypothetical protein
LGSLLFGRIRSLFLLFLALVRAVVKRAFGRGYAGIGDFRRNYDADRLPPVTAEERARLPAFGRCIACGLCDRGEGERMAQSGGVYPGLMQLVLAGSRSMPDFSASARGFAVVPREVLQEKEAICPTGVPFLEIATFVTDKAAEVQRSLPPPALEPAATSGAPAGARLV